MVAVNINKLVVDRLLSDKYGRWREVFDSNQLSLVVERISREIDYFSSDEKDDNVYIDDLEHTVRRICDTMGMSLNEVFDDFGRGSMLDGAVGTIIERMERWQKESHDPKLRV